MERVACALQPGNATVAVFNSSQDKPASDFMKRASQMHFPCSTAYSARECMAQEKVLQEKCIL